MAVSAVLCLCFVSLAVGQQVCRDDYGTPYREGEEVTVNRSWLRCWGGQLTLTGCLTHDGRKVGLGQKIDHKGYEKTCQEVSPTVSHLTPTACIHEDKVVRAGQSVRTPYFVYTCKQHPTGVSLEITACVDENGREIHPGQELVRGDFQYQCSLANGYVSLLPVGCLYDGAEYPGGTTFDGDKFWYTCEVRDNTINRRIDGCLDRRGQRIHPGAQFHRNGFVVACEHMGNGVATRVVGCTEELPNGQLVEHSVGSNWVEGVEPFKYTVYCTTCSDGRTVMKSLTKCRLGAGSGFGTFSRLQDEEALEPGCMKPMGGSLACCGTTETGGLRLHMDAYTPENMEKWRQRGYRMC